MGVNRVDQECERVRQRAVSAVCFRCNRPAVATLSVEATIGATRLNVSGEAHETAVCAACVLELAAWFKIGDQSTFLEQAACSLPGETVGPA